MGLQGLQGKPSTSSLKEREEHKEPLASVASQDHEVRVSGLYHQSSLCKAKLCFTELTEILTLFKVGILPF